MKLQDIEHLLALPHEAQVKLKNLDEEFIREMSRYYGAYLEDSMFFTSTELKRNDVTLILNSKPKTLTNN